MSNLIAFLREAICAMDDFIEMILNRYGWTASAVSSSDRPTIRTGKMPPRRQVTMAMADELEAAGSFATAELARRYAIDRPRWWHRFIRRHS